MPLIKLIDYFEYKAENGLPAVVEVRIYKHAGKTVLIASDTDTGPSITNSVEQLATALRRLGIRWDIFIEHYPEYRTYWTGRWTLQNKQTFDMVIFRWRHVARFEDNPYQAANDPKWQRLSISVINEYIGEEFKF